MKKNYGDSHPKDRGSQTGTQSNQNRGHVSGRDFTEGYGQLQEEFDQDNSLGRNHGSVRNSDWAEDSNSPSKNKNKHRR